MFPRSNSARIRCGCAFS
uniref:Uncharacterized protein n=1 Tax=Arundo donax TaxID=35708 RepID=A0A0A9AS68_ARUDO